jgi:hypothetical protein
MHLFIILFYLLSLFTMYSYYFLECNARSHTVLMVQLLGQKNCVKNKKRYVESRML